MQFIRHRVSDHDPWMLNPAVSFIPLFLTSFHSWVAESERAFFGSGGKGKGKTAAESAELLAAEREFLAHFLHH